jgi:hypothetical protein
MYLDRLGNAAVAYLCTAPVRRSTNREGLGPPIHPQRACNLGARPLHRRPNQQDMSFSGMQDAEPLSSPGLTDPDFATRRECGLWRLSLDHGHSTILLTGPL